MKKPKPLTHVKFDKSITFDKMLDHIKDTFNSPQDMEPHVIFNSSTQLVEATYPNKSEAYFVTLFSCENGRNPHIKVLHHLHNIILKAAQWQEEVRLYRLAHPTKPESPKKAFKSKYKKNKSVQPKPPKSHNVIVTYKNNK